MQQQRLIPGWVPAAERMPDPGQEVLACYRGEDGAAGPIVATPIHANGSHILDGRPIYRPTLWWMPIPPLPASGLPVNGRPLP